MKEIKEVKGKKDRIFFTAKDERIKIIHADFLTTELIKEKRVLI